MKEAADQMERVECGSNPFWASEAITYLFGLRKRPIRSGGHHAAVKRCRSCHAYGGEDAGLMGPRANSKVPRYLWKYGECQAEQSEMHTGNTAER